MKVLDFSAALMIPEFKSLFGYCLRRGDEIVNDELWRYCYKEFE